MKRILFLNHTNDLYGAETILLQIIRNLAVDENNNCIYVITPQINGPSSFKKVLYSMNVNNVTSLPYKSLGISLSRSLLVLIFNIYSLFRLIYYISKNRIDVIYSNTSVTSLGVIVAALLNKRHIWHFHESIYFELFRDRRLAYIYKFLLSYKNNIIIFISKIQKGEWEHFIKKPINVFKIIYNPNKEIDIIQYNKSLGVEENIVYGYLGSFISRKNVVLLVKAFSELKKNENNISLILGGDGKGRKLIEKLIKEFRLESSIKLIGNVDNVSSFLSEIDIFVLPSFYESWGLSAIEAMLAQKAVIITINTALCELFVNKNDCLFFDPWNESELFDSMKLLLDKDIRSSLAMNGYEKVIQYNFNEKFRESIKSLFA
jgi:glycosyltransferase involved in cell wall biosynthesis